MYSKWHLSRLSDCMPYSLSLPGLRVSLCLFLQAFLWGHRTGSQLIRHCICTKSHFYIIGYHKAVNATIQLKSLYIIPPLPHLKSCHLPLIWSAEFIIYFLCFGFSQKKQTIRFLIPLLNRVGGFNDLLDSFFFFLPPLFLMDPLALYHFFSLPSQRSRVGKLWIGI